MLYRALHPLEYLEARTVAEASEMCSSYQGKASLLAGGCSLIPLMKHGALKPQALVTMSKIDGLRYIEGTREQGLKIGALATLRDAEKSLAVLKDFPTLFDSITQIASVQVKNMGTIVGNITEGTPASDVATMLIALGAALASAAPAQAGSHGVGYDIAQLGLRPAVDYAARQMEQQINDARCIFAAKQAPVELFLFGADSRQIGQGRKQGIRTLLFQQVIRDPL